MDKIFIQRGENVFPYIRVNVTSFTTILTFTFTLFTLNTSDIQSNPQLFSKTANLLIILLAFNIYFFSKNISLTNLIPENISYRKVMSVDQLIEFPFQWIHTRKSTGHSLVISRWICRSLSLEYAWDFCHLFENSLGLTLIKPTRYSPSIRLQMIKGRSSSLERCTLHMPWAERTLGLKHTTENFIWHINKQAVVCQF